MLIIVPIFVDDEEKLYEINANSVYDCICRRKC